MAPPGHKEAMSRERVAPRGVPAEEEETQRENLVSMMASLGLGASEHESAAAAEAVVPFSRQEVGSSYESRFWMEGEAAAVPFWREDAAPAGRFLPAPVPGHGVMDPYAYAPPPPLMPVNEALGGRMVPRGGWFHEEGHHPRPRGCVVGPWNRRGAVTIPARHGYMEPPPFMHGGAPVLDVNPPMDPDLVPSKHEQEVLLLMSQEDPKKIVSYAYNLMEDKHGQRLFCLVFMHCNLELREWIVARITRNQSFWRICARRSDEVVYMIKYCGTRGSMLHLRDAMASWMTSNNMTNALMTDSSRVKVVLAFMQWAPRDIAQFIFEAVSRNCTKLACQPNGSSLLEECLSHVSQEEKDDIFTKISYESLYLSQHSCGNYIVQDVLKKGGPLHHAIIASCFRYNYVVLSTQKYSSNVVEQCLKLFGERERQVIVNELISYPRFGDLVMDEFANFVLFTVLRTCRIHLRDMLATAIVSQDIRYRNQNCLKIFTLLSKLGYVQQ